jgi:hypothetical protein
LLSQPFLVKFLLPFEILAKSKNFPSVVIFSYRKITLSRSPPFAVPYIFFQEIQVCRRSLPFNGKRDGLPSSTHQDGDHTPHAVIHQEACVLQVGAVDELQGAPPLA